MNEKQLIKSSSGAVTGFRHKLMLITSDLVPGYRITKVFGLVRGNTIRARHIGRDIMVLFRMIVGGEVREYTKLMGESREQALDRMAEQAIDLEANAVVGLRFSTSTLIGGAAEFMAYGTAVYIEKEASVKSQGIHLDS